MKVVIDGVSSETISVDSGVPQGTVLGPLLFLCHINDLLDSVTSNVRLFAENLETWAVTWGMWFNASKCYILSIKPKSSFIYKLNDTILKNVKTNPYLGILFSDNLSWQDHIDKVCKM